MSLCVGSIRGQTSPRMQHPTPAARSRQRILPCPLPAFRSPKEPYSSNRDARTWDLCSNIRMSPSTSPPRLCHGIFLHGRREQCVDVYRIKGPATIPSRRCRPQHGVSSLPPGALKAGCPFCPRLWPAVRASPGWKGLRTQHLTAMALICTSTDLHALSSFGFNL